MQNHPDVMFIQFTKDKGLTFYNTGDERVGKRSKTHNDRYLRQEGATKPVISMMPHPFASGHRRMYPSVSVKNDTPCNVNFVKVLYCACRKDENTFIVSGGAWTVETCRGGCLVTQILANLIVPDGTRTGRVLECAKYLSSGTSYSKFYIMWIDGVCCLRSWAQDSDKCTFQQCL